MTRKITTTTPAGSVCVVTEGTREGFPLNVTMTSHRGVPIIAGASMSWNAAWALHVALTQFFGNLNGECTSTEEEL